MNVDPSESNLIRCRDSHVNFPWTFREVSEKFPHNWRNKSQNYLNLAVELYKVTSNKINNSALLPRDSRI